MSITTVELAARLAEKLGWDRRVFLPWDRKAAKDDLDYDPGYRLRTDEEMAELSTTVTFLDPDGVKSIGIANCILIVRYMQDIANDIRREERDRLLAAINSGELREMAKEESDAA